MSIYYNNTVILILKSVKSHEKKFLNLLDYIIRIKYNFVEQLHI